MVPWQYRYENIKIIKNTRIAPFGSRSLHIKVTQASASLGFQVPIGYESSKIRLLGQGSGAGEWDLLTGKTYLTGSIGLRLQTRRDIGRVGWDYVASGRLPLPISLPKISAPHFSIKLLTTCECMNGIVDGIAIINKLL